MDNDASLLRREIMIRIARMTWEDRLETDLRLLPYQMIPSGAPTYRCCVHHERVIVKDRALAVLGMDLKDRDETWDLNEAAKQSLSRETFPPGPPLTLVEEACQSCLRGHYMVSNACQGCVARPCTRSCRKQAISLKNGRAEIDPDKCVNCGLCLDACPYHAILYLPIPCEEACPVGAISKSQEGGKEEIDFAQCILCGRCIRACPFGAVMERSQMVDVIRALKEGQPMAALVAPAVLGQFPGTYEQILAAVSALGFSRVEEVALAAEETARQEAEEWVEKRMAGEKFLSSSCCPSYVMAAGKIPGFQEKISHTPSPMVIAARESKKRNPEIPTVFIGPCTAKRLEAADSGVVDFVLSFEELGALFISRKIEVANCLPREGLAAGGVGRGFGISGGVAGALTALGIEGLVPEVISGLNKKALGLLKVYAMGKGQGNFVEGMACPGGCANGPGVICDLGITKSQWDRLGAQK